MFKNFLRKFSSDRYIGLRLLILLNLAGVIWFLILEFINKSSHQTNLNVFYIFSLIGISIGIPSLFFKKFGQIISHGYKKLVCIFDTIIIWTSLPIFYYLFFSPYAVLLRCFDKVNMNSINNKNKFKSNWTDINYKKNPKNYFRQF